MSGSAFAVDFGTNFHASLNNHPVKFSFVLANLGSNLNYSRHRPRTATCTRDPLPGEDQVPTLPQQANLLTKDFPLPTTFRVGLAYDVITGDNNRLTVLGDFNQPNNNKPGFAVGSEWKSSKLGGSNFGFALRGQLQLHRRQQPRSADQSTTALSDEEKLQGLAFGGGLQYGGRATGSRLEPRLRVQVSRHPRPDQLLQLHAGVVGGRLRAASRPSSLGVADICLQSGWAALAAMASWRVRAGAGPPESPLVLRAVRSYRAEQGRTEVNAFVQVPYIVLEPTARGQRGR